MDAETILHFKCTIKRIKYPWYYDLHFNPVLSLRLITLLFSSMYHIKVL